MLKLVLLAAALAAVTSGQFFPAYMQTPYVHSPYGVVPFGYTGPVPVPYLRTGIPTPFVGGHPYADAVATEDQPLLPFTSVPSKPLYLRPEQHHLYQDAVNSHDPLGYVDKKQPEGVKKQENRFRQ